MVIHRVGPAPDVAPARQPLGRVLVTIDDLDALIIIMKQEADDPTSVQVQFSGGYFTDAKDITQLSDDEILSLRVHSDNAEVNLEPTQATAVGNSVTTTKIRNAWARRRQTTIEPNRSYVTSSIISGGVGILLGVGFMMLLLFNSPPDGNWITRGVGASAGALMALGFVWITIKNVRFAGNMPGAIIKPMTWQDFRRLRDSNQYPRLSWIWAVVATIIAVIAVIVSIVQSQ